MYFLLGLCCCFVKCSSCFFLLGQACHHTESLQVSSQEPIVESRFGFPTFHSEASKSSLNRLQAQNCIEMNLMQSILVLNEFQTSDPLEVSLDRKTIYKDFFKEKSDFVKEPISNIVLERIWKIFLKEERVFMIMDPYGG